MVYDKTVFKPKGLSDLGRYSLSLIEPDEASGQPDTQLPSSENSAAVSDAPPEPPSQFDLGDFSKMKPSAESAGGNQEDAMPLLGGPDVEK